MSTMLKSLIAVMVVLGLSLNVMAAKEKAADKEYTVKGKLAAAGVVLDKQTAEKVTANVVATVDGKSVGSVEKIALTQDKKNKETWTGSFTLKIKVAEKANVKFAVTAEGSFKDSKTVKKLQGESSVAAGKATVDAGTIKLAEKKAAAKKQSSEKKK